MNDRWAWAAEEDYYRRFVGVDYFRARKIYLRALPEFSGAFVNWAFDRLNNTVTLRCAQLSDQTMENYFRVFNTFKPELVNGNPGHLYAISRFFEKKGGLTNKPEVIVSTGEVLHDFEREKIEQVFGTRIYDFYGARECPSIAGECSHGLMHLFTHSNRVEVLGCKSDGDEGEVAITTLHNFSMPLIRYRIGDEAVLGPSKCGCGSPLPTLRSVIGRTNDHFLTKDGRLIHGLYFTRFLRRIVSVEEFKIIQEDYDRIRIVLVAKKLDRKWTDQADARIREVMGVDCKVMWELVDEIPQSIGKHSYTSSMLFKG
jgi:phenylacetate-CoA ligase